VVGTQRTHECAGGVRACQPAYGPSAASGASGADAERGSGPGSSLTTSPPGSSPTTGSHWNSPTASGWASPATSPRWRCPATTASAARAELLYGDAPAGYTTRPQEQVAYVSAHDNETLFDALAAKLPVPTSMDDRVRMQVVALASVLLGQGTPFLHAGSELLRSKSLDRDSYRSGDWFNAIDWTASSTRWGVGLPPGRPTPRSANCSPSCSARSPRPEPRHIQTCRDHVLAAAPAAPTLAAVRAAHRRRGPGAPAVPPDGGRGPTGQVVWSLHGGQRADHDLLLVLNASPVRSLRRGPPWTSSHDAPGTRSRSPDPEPRHDRAGLHAGHPVGSSTRAWPLCGTRT
jgi:hypothetical protein